MCSPWEWCTTRWWTASPHSRAKTSKKSWSRIGSRKWLPTKTSLKTSLMNASNSSNRWWNVILTNESHSLRSFRTRYFLFSRSIQYLTKKVEEFR
jgi:hypothetical protein